MDLNGVPSEVVDFVWSYDVFVHLDPECVQGYLREIYRVLKSGGVAVIHHPGQHPLRIGLRKVLAPRLYFLRRLPKG